MKVLFLHPNMPGQFKHTCRAFAENPDNTVVFVTKRDDIEIPGVHCVPYKVRKEPSPHTHRYITGFARSVLQGQEVWRTCKKLKEEEGFVPDVIVAHPGWGDTMYMKDLFPSTPILNFFEFFYHAEGADVNFAPDEKTTPDDDARIRTKNATNLFALQYCDWGFCPTFWQLKQHPKEYYHRISVIHDGIDTDLLVPNENVKVTTPSGVTLTRKDEVVTYVARNFEPYRGFPTFMRAAEIILKERPNTHILAIGADGVSYGKRLTNGKTYRELMMEEVTFCDPSRIHFMGTLPYDRFIEALQVGSAHIYLTYPFVLSWSMVESMSAGCTVIGSDTTPVTEVIEDGRNGLLVDFFSAREVANRVNEVFAHPTRMQHIREAARQTVLDKYALKTLLPLHMGLVEDLARGELAPPTAERINALYADSDHDKFLKLVVGQR